MLQKLLNIGTNSLKRRNMPVMVNKVITRLKEHSAANDAPQAVSWAKENAQSLEDYINHLDPALWQETKTECDILTEKARAKLDALGMDLGGGGHYYLLYFLTRYFKPKTIVETGVAAGWSSQSLLTALHKNGGGALFSSDFPYFRYKNPEKYVGYLVDEEFKQNWMLFIDGDENNLPRIAQQLKNPVDLFHYDSDKSREGRNYAFNILQPKLADDAVVVFDDIQDNFHFKDFVTRKKWPFKVFEFEEKYIGLTGPYFNHENK
jgi:predicted O-methyltransferase YrrM